MEILRNTVAGSDAVVRGDNAAVDEIPQPRKRLLPEVNGRARPDGIKYFWQVPCPHSDEPVSKAEESGKTAF